MFPHPRTNRRRLLLLIISANPWKAHSRLIHPSTPHKLKRTESASISVVFPVTSHLKNSIKQLDALTNIVKSRYSHFAQTHPTPESQHLFILKMLSLLRNSIRRRKSTLRSEKNNSVLRGISSTLTNKCRSGIYS